MTDPNPNTTKQRAVKEATSRAYLERGRVMSAPDHSSGDDTRHTIEVKPYGKDATYTAIVTVTSKGDTNIPPEDDIIDSEVLVARREGAIPVVITQIYTTESDVPDYKAGERKIGHPLSSAEIYINESGNVTLTNDSGTIVEIDGSDIILNGGTNGAITDIDTTKDADGHVTSITPVRNSNILI